MDRGELFKERKEIIFNAFHMKRNSRVPIFSNIWTWKVLDSEYSLEEALNDYEIMEKAVCEFQERYQFDALFDLGTRNPTKVVKALGGQEYHKIDQATESLYVIDHSLMEPDEYKEFVEENDAFLWTKIFQRYCPNLSFEQLNHAAKEYLEFNQFSARIAKRFIEEYECVPVPAYYLKQPFEYFFTALRGMKGASIDLRRRKQEVIEAVEFIYETITLPVMQRVIASDTSAYMCDMYTAFLGHSILSYKQFGEIYWPILKRCLDMFEESGKMLLIQGEGAILYLADYFKDLPVGVIAIQLEQDDIFEMRRKLPNICLVGGMPTSLLGHGSVQECVDKAKELIDGLGDGYILSQDKMISYRCDCKRENLLAINEFVREYRT